MSENKGMRELSMDEMDKVSGGFDGLYDKNGNYLTGAQVVNLGISMAQSFGYDIAGKAMCELFQISPNEAKKFGKNGAKSDVEKMDSLLNQLIQIYDRIEGSGHSY